MNADERVRLRLHGYPVSNYFSIARAALIEKQAEFAIVIMRPSYTEQFIRLSPMGKIPVLETVHGWIAETVAILEYIEDAVEGPALHPADVFLRARGRQIINVVQMYVERPMRELFPGVFAGQANLENTVGSVREILDRATRALQQLLRPSPYLLGSLSYADLFVFYCLDIADRVTRFVYSRSIIAEVGGLADWSRLMAGRASSQCVFADFYPAFRAYLANNKAAYDCHADISQVLVPPATVGA